MEHAEVGLLAGEQLRASGGIEPPLDGQRTLAIPRAIKSPAACSTSAGSVTPKSSKCCATSCAADGHTAPPELIGPQQVGALEQPMVLGRAGVLVAELGRVDGIFQAELGKQALDLGATSGRGRPRLGAFLFFDAITVTSETRYEGVPGR